MMAKTGKRKLKKNVKHFLSLMFGALMVISATIMVYAYLSASSGQLINSFAVDSDPSISIGETFDDYIKSKVYVDVGNPGYAVYVRAVIVASWKKDGQVYSQVYSQAPILGTDYSLSINEEGWIKGEDGFYYHKEMVVYDGENEVSKRTSDLINECKQLTSSPEGYTLHVEIIAQTIQALGTTDNDDNVYAVEDAWGVVLNDEKEISGFEDSQ